ncbi:MAG: MmgE/PrpD family protein [Betaproteobacteria bacterium]|nr:MmgE/PrpD family protein [Betaproteobacteria bacterium]
MTDYLDKLCNFAAGLRYDQLGAPTVTQAKVVIADTLAVIAAGSREPEVIALARKKHILGSSSVVGTGTRAAASTAAFLNGVAGTWLEMDEGNRYSRGHPSIHVLPAAFAYAEAHHLAGRDLLVAVVLGYEVGARIGIASNLRAAMHPHGTWGTVGAAVAVAKLAGVDTAKMREVINVASSLTLATSKNTMLQGGTVRNAYAGVSNQMGLLALELVGCGFSGERDGLGSVFGAVVSESFDRAKMVEGLGDRWQINMNYFKRHSCCRYNHGALDALDGILAKTPLQADEVERIEVASYRYAAELNDQAPHNVLAAKFSVPFALATRIVTGSSGLASFTWDRVRDQTIQALAKKVFVREDPALTAMLPQLRPARVTIHLRDGRELKGAADSNRGDDQDPYSREELCAKFSELTERAWSREAAQDLLEKLQRLDELRDVNLLLS